MSIPLTTPLGKYFTVKDFIKSDYNTKPNMLGEDGGKYGSAEQQLKSAEDLFENIVDPVYENPAFGFDGTKNPNFYMTSGFRAHQLNNIDLPKAGYKTSPNSQHKYAQAVDMGVVGISTMDVYNFIYDNMFFDQLIWEYPEKGGINKRGGSWVHCSYVSGKNRNKGTLATTIQSYRDVYADQDTTRRGNYLDYIERAALTPYEARKTYQVITLPVIQAPPLTDPNSIISTPYTTEGSQAAFYDEI